MKKMANIELCYIIIYQLVCVHVRASSSMYASSCRFNRIPFLNLPLSLSLFCNCYFDFNFNFNLNLNGIVLSQLNQRENEPSPCRQLNKLMMVMIIRDEFFLSLFAKHQPFGDKELSGNNNNSLVSSLFHFCSHNINLFQCIDCLEPRKILIITIIVSTLF